MRLLPLYIAFAFFLLPSIHAHGQSMGDNWYFGDSAGIRFVNDTAVPLTNSLIHTQEACASISDSNGNLLFYTDGITVWNSNSIMDNGSGLAGGNINPGFGSSSTNGVTIIPYPNSDSLYYIISVESLDTTIGLMYSEVDMSQNGGLGKVTTNKNIQLIADSLCEKVNAVKHANGRDWWVICRSLRRGYNRFYKMLMTPAGWQGPFVQDIGTMNVFPWIAYLGGESEFSALGDRYFCLSSTGQLDLFEFDRCAGELINLNALGDVNPPSIWLYGGSFSPLGTKLYVSNLDSLFQYDLTSPDIKSSKALIWTDNSSDWAIGQLEQAPDGKIFVCSTWYTTQGDTVGIQNTNLGVIEFPDSTGILCQFQPYSVSLGSGRSFTGLPNNPNYALGPLVGSPCDTLGVAIDKPLEQGIWIYPNPNDGKFTIQFRDLEAPISYKIQDLTGRVFLVTELRNPASEIELDISALPAGTYLIELSWPNGKTERVKVSVVK